MKDTTIPTDTEQIDEISFVEDVLYDYKICCISREVSLIGRKEVLRGKAKFGIFGDGKEVAQVAMARAFRKGDFRSGYYRDQTFMFALGLCTVEDYFAQLYADAENDIYSGGRQMNAHFATPLIDKNGEFTAHTTLYNVSSDISPTAGQMARALGIAYASKLYRANKNLHTHEKFSINGNEISFCTIGDASTSEGIFWETINAAAVLQVPLAVSVWDDGYGISVPKRFQTAKGSISDALSGMEGDYQTRGLSFYTANGWDYPSLCEVYMEGIEKMRTTHTPALFHIKECTQPQGHSTSGDHRRYKSEERLKWESEFDCIKKMREWIIEMELASPQDLDTIQEEAKKVALNGQKNAWRKYNDPIQDEMLRLTAILEVCIQESQNPELPTILANFKKIIDPVRRDAIITAKSFLRSLKTEKIPTRVALENRLQEMLNEGNQRFCTDLHSETKDSALLVPEIRAVYAEDASEINGYEIMRHCFEKAFSKYPELYAFGEDVGQIGDVNQGFAGLQEKFQKIDGTKRIFDTGIREWSILGQGLGISMRGLKAITEIQYLDYLVYAMSVLTDDIATLRYRSAGQQKAPLIIRTRGHRLEGVWHTGSPMGMILNAIRGIYFAVPRNMTQAAGLYNTFLEAGEPALIVECLNSYRLKEKLPTNIGEFTVPIGVPEILQKGTDITLVTYGSCVRIAEEASEQAKEMGISIELIDAQMLLPFDRPQLIVASLQKTNRLIVLDEDVPGGASAYILKEIVENQKGYQYLDSAPVTITAAANRSAYGSDGDYFTKPNPEQVFEAIYAIMHEAKPNQYPTLYF
jgi:pyruvate/2-oxoglutarate/acetoin dehydrogenase E1 component/TPP-dependent pyruvate/acetoin dehydrogenase alpha subunit